MQREITSLNRRRQKRANSRAYRSRTSQTCGNDGFAEQVGIDNAVINWFGLVATLFLWPITTLAGVMASVVRCIG